MNLRKHLAALSCLLLPSLIATAQNTTNGGNSQFTQNTYISASIGDTWAWSKGINGNGFLGKISIGSRFNDTSGLRINFGLGKREFNFGQTVGYYSVGADYTLSLLNLFGAFNHNSRFMLDLNVGAAYNRLRDGEHRNRPSINVGIGAGYRFAPHWGIFAEAGASGTEFRKNGDRQIGIGIDLAVGLRYCFGRVDETPKGNDQLGKQVEYLNSEINRLNDEVNMLRHTIDSMPKVAPERKIMIAPQNEAGSIDIFFEEYSTFIGEDQRAKISAIGNWLKENNYNIWIVAFSDNLNNADIDGKLRSGRTQAIRNLLETTYGIASDRITVVNAEEMGYKNMSGCNAKILFVEPSK